MQRSYSFAVSLKKRIKMPFYQNMQEHSKLSYIRTSYTVLRDFREMQKETHVGKFSSRVHPKCLQKIAVSSSHISSMRFKLDDVVVQDIVMLALIHWWMKVEKNFPEMANLGIQISNIDHAFSIYFY